MPLEFSCHGVRWCGCVPKGNTVHNCRGQHSDDTAPREKHSAGSGATWLYNAMCMLALNTYAWLPLLPQQQREKQKRKEEGKETLTSAIFKKVSTQRTGQWDKEISFPSISKKSWARRQCNLRIGSNPTSYFKPFPNFPAHNDLSLPPHHSALTHLPSSAKPSPIWVRMSLRAETTSLRFLQHGRGAGDGVTLTNSPLSNCKNLENVPQCGSAPLLICGPSH